jgi:hypothetical protein
MPHSPGPWHTVDGTVFAAVGGTVCHVERGPNHLANKHLILAAPDMLEALQLCAKSRINKATKVAILHAINTALGI